MSYTIEGEEELKRRMLAFGRDMEQAMYDGVIVTANDVRKDTVKSIQDQSFGTYVQRSKQGGGGTYTHIAAAPGKAPNTDTGALASSYAVEGDRDDISAEVGSSLDYASHQEFGTKRMEARPHLMPAVEKNRGELDNNIVKAGQAIVTKRANQ